MLRRRYNHLLESLQLGRPDPDKGEVGGSSPSFPIGRPGHMGVASAQSRSARPPSRQFSSPRSAVFASLPSRGDLPGFLLITKSPLVPYTCGTPCRKSSQARPQPAPAQSASGRTGHDDARAASSARTPVLPRTAAYLLAGDSALPPHPHG